MKVILTIKSGQFNAVRSWFGAGSPEQATIRVLNAFNMQTKCKDVADSSVAWDESFEFVSLQSHVTLAILSKADGFPIATTVVRFMPLEEQQPYTVTFFQGSNMYFRLFVEIQVINVTPSISDYGVDLILESLGLITNCAQALVEMAKETDKSPDLKAEMSPSENTLGSILGSSDSETGTDSDIAENLEGLVDVKLLADLVAQSRDFIAKFTGNQSSTTLIDDLTRPDTTLSNINVDFYIPQSSSSNSISGADAGQAGILDVLGDIANCHPILKLTWFILSAGYKMATRAKQEQEKLQELSEKFIAASKEIDRLKSIKIIGIPESVRDILRDSMNLYVFCLKNVLKILSKHLSSQAKNMVSSLFGSNLDEINSVLESLDVAKSHLANTKRDGTFFLALETVQKLESMARQVDDVAKDVKSIKAAISIVSRSSTDIASDFLREQLSPNIDDHSTGEITSLVQKRGVGTRDWIISRMIQLLGDTSYDAKRIVWLRGEAGTGKSVIAGCVAKELKKTNILAGSFFCQHDNKKRDNVAAMIQNLSYQLAHADECFKDALGRSLQDTPLKGRKKRNTKELVDHLILSPMGKWPSNKPCVIVIDALDELTDMDKVSTIFESFQSTPIKLFLTSRHDVPITFDVKTLSHLETFNIKDERNMNDIEVFTRNRLTQMLSDYEGLKDEIDSLVPALVKESNGLFIWISLVLGNVEEFERFEVREEDVKKILVEVEYSSTRMPWLDLKKRLVELTKLDLPSLYCRALFKAYPTPELQRDFKIVIGVLLEAKIPLSKRALIALVTVTAESSHPAKVADILERLRSLLVTDDSNKLKFIHKTVHDYLKTPICHSDCMSGYLCQSLEQEGVHCCHNQASHIFLADFNSSSINMAVACMTIVNRIKLEDEDESIIRLVDFTEEEEYAITYWQSHFSDAFGKAPHAQQIELIRSLHTLSCENPRKLGYFVEELMTRGKLNDVFMGIALVTSCLSAVDFERMHVKEIQTRFRELTSKLQRQGLYLELDGDKEE